jgi:hypothetical protein
MPKLVYHVLPDQGKWIVRKGSAKKASVVKDTKKEAMEAASDLAKSSPNSQVIVHKADGVIGTHWLYTRSDYDAKVKKKQIVKKAKKTKAKNKKKAQEDVRKHRKAALLGVARKKKMQADAKAPAKKTSAAPVQEKPGTIRSFFAKLFKKRG